MAPHQRCTFGNPSNPQPTSSPRLRIPHHQLVHARGGAQLVRIQRRALPPRQITQDRRGFRQHEAVVDQHRHEPVGVELGERRLVVLALHQRELPHPHCEALVPAEGQHGARRGRHGIDKEFHLVSWMRANRGTRHAMVRRRRVQRKAAPRKIALHG
jgi:hypothetical protein